MSSGDAVAGGCFILWLARELLRHHGRQDPRFEVDRPGRCGKGSDHPEGMVWVMVGDRAKIEQSIKVLGIGRFDLSMRMDIRSKKEAPGSNRDRMRRLLKDCYRFLVRYTQSWRLE
jgi:hypothetical protein